ncbi:MAG: translocation/assembly module TamB, partial [Prevotellaceae bacterium]|nr:translocation/assembly module TamB [Prevotellaceae bacterium]
MLVYFLAALPAVQTFLVRQVSGVLSEKAYPASVSVGAVYYSFFTKLVVEDVHVSDMNGDTLFYVNELSLSISSFSYVGKKITLHSVRLNGGVFNLCTYPGNEKNTTNIAAIVEKFKNGSSSAADTLSGKPWDIKVENVALSDFRFTFRNLANPADDPDPRIIDFKNLDVRDIYVDARRLRVSGDTLFFELKEVRCLENSGYRLKHLSAKRGHVCSTQTMLEETELTDDYSHLVMHYYKMDYENGKSFNRYETDVRMEADFDDALFSFRSIERIAKRCNMQSEVRIAGVVSGTVADLRGNFLQITTTSSKTQLLAKFRIDGLPDIKETVIDVNVIRLTTDANDLSGLLQGMVYPDTLDLQVLQPLTAINMMGNFTGFYNDFVVEGVLLTSIGNADFDLSFGFGGQEPGVRIRGDARVHNLNIGKLVNAPSVLGGVTGTFIADGKILPESMGGLQIKATGHLSKFDFLKYHYRNINFNGIAKRTGFDGSMTVKDPNLNLYFNGSISREEARRSANTLQLNFDAAVHYADLTALHLNTRDSVSIVKADLKAGYEMHNAFEGTGDIAVSGIEYTGNGGKQSVGNVVIQSGYHAGRRRMTVRSDFLDADYVARQPAGIFFDNIVHVFTRQHLPVVNTGKLRDTATAGGEYNLKATFKNIVAVADNLLPGLYIAPGTKLSVTLSERDSLNLLLTGSRLAWNDYQLKDISWRATGDTLRSYSVFKAGDANISGFTMRNLISLVTLADNKLDFKIDYDNRTELENKGNLSATLDFIREQKTGHVLTNLQIGESKFIINNAAWNIAPASIWFNKKIHVDNFHVYNNRQDIHIGGVLSDSKRDTLTVTVKDFDASNINYWTAKEKYNFAGLLSGEAKIVDVYHSLHCFAQLTVDSLLVNDRLFGNMDIRSWWHNQDRQLLLHAAAQIDTLRVMDIEGIYSPNKKYLDLFGTFNSFQISHVAPLLKSVLSNVDGTVSGKVRLYGRLPNLVTEGTQLQADNLAATVDYLQTRYSFSSPLFLNAGSFGFKNAEAGDGLGGVATLSLTVSHTDFKNWQYEVAAYPRNLCVMNTTEKDNDVFYGRAYATGAALIKGNADNVVFDINLKADRNSVLHIPAFSSSQATSAGLLSFARPQENIVRNDPEKSAETDRKAPNIDISLNLGITPDTEVLLELDKKSEDVIRGFGTGDIRMEINPSANKFNMYGDYRVSKGDYLFTIQNFNLITKRFDFAEGGRVTFNGDLQKMNLDLSAIYKTTTSLHALLVDSTAMTTRRPVSCRIDITGNLFNPVITLGVDIENLDVETRARVQSALNTEEKRTRQFLSLLAFGGFLSDDQSEFNADLLMGSATGLVTSQINNLFSRFNLPLGFGFSYQPSQRGRDDAFEV